MIMLCGFKTAKATVVQCTVNTLHVATPGEQLNTTVHVSFLLQLAVLRHQYYNVWSLRCTCSEEKMTYSEEYLRFGFSFLEEKGVQKPQCVSS